MHTPQQIKNLSEDFLEALGFGQKIFNVQSWEKFLQENFSQDFVKKIQTEICQDCFFYKTQEKSTEIYYIGKLLSIRPNMRALAAHRVFQYWLNENQNPVGASLLDAQNKEQKSEQFRHTLYECECLAQKMQEKSTIIIHPLAQIETPVAIAYGSKAIIDAEQKVSKKTFIK